MPRDYYVDFRSEETIAQIATQLRDAHGSRNDDTFNIVEFVEQTLPAQLKGSKRGRLKVQFYDRDFKEDDPAYVTFDPLTLYSDTGVWMDARIGEAYPRYVIAHEIGHIVLHDHSAKAFSNDRSAQIRFAEDGHSAEWQANTFAGHFLLPTQNVQKLQNVTVIAAYCQVPDNLALERVLAVKRQEHRKKRVFEGDFCSKCGSFSLVRSGTLLKCTTFGCDRIVSRF